MPKQLPLHPLINPNSPHYDTGSKPSIQKFEEKHSVQKLMNWAEISIDKYRDEGRASKGQQEQDIIKAKTYEDYFNMLRSLVLKNKDLANITAAKAYQKLNIYWRYK